MDSTSNLELLIKRDRGFVLAGLTGTTILAWIYLVSIAADMDASLMSAMAKAQIAPWNAHDFWLMLIMWAT